MYCSSNYGPVFGGWILHDLCITNDDGWGSSNLGKSYQCPPGQQGTFFTGAERFSVTDYEVFGLSQ